MAATIHDRDTYLRNNKAKLRAQGEEQQRRWKQQDKEVRRGGFGAAWSAMWSSLFRAGMYSSDPTIARIGMVRTAQAELGNQRVLAAQAEARRAAQEDARMERLAQQVAQQTAQALFDLADRRRTTR